MASQSSGTQESGSAGQYVYDSIIDSSKKASKKTSQPASDKDSSKKTSQPASDKDSSKRTSKKTSQKPEPKFRLLELLPATHPHEPIVCRLQTYPFNEAEPYEALSYVWGDDSHEFRIQLDGGWLSVTHNLHTALRHLRREPEREAKTEGKSKSKTEGNSKGKTEGNSKGKTEGNSKSKTEGKCEGELQGKRTMWIDALCINQEDEDEKKAQLAIMPEIYNRAERVVVWLGPAANNSDEAMDFINKNGMMANNPKEEKKVREQIMESSENRLRRALAAIMEREYWTRVWVVQEIVKAKDIILVCGESSTSWDNTTAVIREFLKSREPSRKLPKTTKMSKNTWAMPTSPLMTLEHLAGYKNTKENERGPDWLMNMFVQLRRFKCTKQNDKIFSIVGLRDPGLFLSKKPEDIPDLSQFEYSWSFREVSLRLFKNFIFTQRKRGTGPNKRAIGSMNILCASQPDPRPKPDNKFPSWLPDFSRDNGMEPWPISETQICDFLESNAEIRDDDTLILQMGQFKRENLTDKDDDYLTDDYLADDCFGLLTRLSTFLQIAHKNGVHRSKIWKTVLLGHPVSQQMDQSYRVHVDESPGKHAGQSSGQKSRKITDLELLEFLRLDLRNALEKDSKRDSKKDSKKDSKQDSKKHSEEDDEAVARSFMDIFRRRTYLRRFAVIKLPDECVPDVESAKVPGKELGKVKVPAMVPAMVPAATKPKDFLYVVENCDCPVVLRKDGKNFRFVGPCFIDVDFYRLRSWVTKMKEDKDRAKEDKDRAKEDKDRAKEGKDKAKEGKDKAKEDKDKAEEIRLK